MDFRVLLLEEIQTIANTVSESCDRLRTALVDAAENAPEEDAHDEPEEEEELPEAAEHKEAGNDDSEDDRQTSMFGARPGPPPTTLPSSEDDEPEDEETEEDSVDEEIQEESTEPEPESDPAKPAFSYKSNSVAQDDDDVYKGSSSSAAGPSGPQLKKPRRGTAVDLVRAKLKELLAVNPKGMYCKVMIEALESSGIKVSRPTISNSLKAMAEENEVLFEKIGREVFYRPVLS